MIKLSQGHSITVLLDEHVHIQKILVYIKSEHTKKEGKTEVQTAQKNMANEDFWALLGEAHQGCQPCSL